MNASSDAMAPRFTAFLTLGGFGTPVNVVGCDAVIIPKFVLVTIEGATILTVRSMCRAHPGECGDSRALREPCQSQGDS